MTAHKKLLVIIAGVVILLVVGFSKYGANIRELSGVSELRTILGSRDYSVAAPGIPHQAQPGTPSSSVLPSTQEVRSTDRRTYGNAEYDFSFTYPAALGEVTVAREAGRDDVRSGCRGAGESFHGSFANNTNVDFGFVTSDYRDCLERPVALFDVVSLEVRGNTIALATSGGAEAFELTIEKVLPTASPGVVAYIVKNTVDAGSRNDLAAIVKSPIRKIGALVFRTRNLPDADALALLDEIITK